MSYRNSGFGTFLLFVGRIFMAAIFVFAGLMKIMDFSSTATMMTSMGVPMSEIILFLGIVFELGGGVLLFFGWYTRLGTLLLLVFVVVVTFVFHSFWDYQGAEHVANLQHFLKNLFIFGALLYVLVHGPGKFSLDNVWRKVE